ncbi:hexose kinase [Virgibacillus soli]|uniref:hexose kinase n=1 Tax=Paracerasibacillus soli TaxID=480284 RepID=UPI0035E53571
MVLTVTLNPSVDIGYNLEQLHLDTVNRVSHISKTAGGKGINVARVLKQLEIEVSATGLIGGSLGKFIKEQLNGIGIGQQFVDITGETRNCIAILHDGKQTEILEGGPEISENEASQFLFHYESIMKETDIVTISGSLPKGLKDNFYEKMVEIASLYDTPVLLDASGKALEAALESSDKPFLIKPNQEELAALIGKALVTESEIIAALQTNPLFEGIPWVVITLGSKGAVIKKDNKFFRADIPKMQAVNPVGSGDSVIAGFAAGLSRQLGDEELIKMAMATGVLNALEERTGYINPEKLDWCMKQIVVETI